MLTAVILAGIPVLDQDVLELARLLRAEGFESTAERLEDAYNREVKVLGLSISEREQILRSIDGDVLGELRGVLLVAHEWRRREGLV